MIRLIRTLPGMARNMQPGMARNMWQGLVSLTHPFGFLTVRDYSSKPTGRYQKVSSFVREDRSHSRQNEDDEKKSTNLFIKLTPFLLLIFLFSIGLFICEIVNSEFFYKLFYKAGVSLGVRALSFFLIKLGCSVGLFAAAILFALKTLVEDPYVENQMLMLPGDASSGASTSNQGQSAMGGQIPASTGQPATPEVPQNALWNDPDQPRRSEANRTDPPGDEVKQPLMVDHQRQMELERRLRLHFIGRHNEIDTIAYDDLIDKQLLIEKKIEIALLNDGYSRGSIFSNRNAIRGYLFYPNGTPLKESTLDHHLKQMVQNGMRQNIPYERIQRAINNYNLFLSK